MQKVMLDFNRRYILSGELVKVEDVEKVLSKKNLKSFSLYAVDLFMEGGFKLYDICLPFHHAIADLNNIIIYSTLSMPSCRIGKNSDIYIYEEENGEGIKLIIKTSNQLYFNITFFEKEVD